MMKISYQNLLSIGKEVVSARNYDLDQIRNYFNRLNRNLSFNAHRIAYDPLLVAAALLWTEGAFAYTEEERELMPQAAQDLLKYLMATEITNSEDTITIVNDVPTEYTLGLICIEQINSRGLKILQEYDRGLVRVLAESFLSQADALDNYINHLNLLTPSSERLDSFFSVLAFLCVAFTTCNPESLADARDKFVQGEYDSSFNTPEIKEQVEAILNLVEDNPHIRVALAAEFSKAKRAVIG